MYCVTANADIGFSKSSSSASNTSKKSKKGSNEDDSSLLIHFDWAPTTMHKWHLLVDKNNIMKDNAISSNYAVSELANYEFDITDDKSQLLMFALPHHQVYYRLNILNYSISN